MAVYFKSVTAYRCERCRHEWLPRRALEQGGALPTVCPKCKSPYWNKPKDGAPSVEDLSDGPRLWELKDGYLVYRVNELYEYEIPVEECNGRPELVLRWLLQVEEKTWASPELVVDLLKAFVAYAELGLR